MPFTCSALRRYLEQEKGKISDSRAICKMIVCPFAAAEEKGTTNQQKELTAGELRGIQRTLQIYPGRISTKVKRSINKQGGREN